MFKNSKKNTLSSTRNSFSNTYSSTQEPFEQYRRMNSMPFLKAVESVVDPVSGETVKKRNDEMEKLERKKRWDEILKKREDEVEKLERKKRRDEMEKLERALKEKKDEIEELERPIKKLKEKMEELQGKFDKVQQIDMNKRLQKIDDLEELQKADVDPEVDVDPFSYGFATELDDDCATYGHLVEDLLKGSKMYEEVQSKFESDQGCLKDVDALYISERIIGYMLTDVFPDWSDWDEDGTKGASNHIWALGVILYFMVCGCPTLEENSAGQNDWYRNLRLGKLAKGRKRRWCDLSLNARKYLKKLLYWNWAYRPQLGFMLGSEWHNEVWDSPVDKVLIQNCRYPERGNVVPFYEDEDLERVPQGLDGSLLSSHRKVIFASAQEEEMKRLKEATARRQNAESNATKREWASFFGEATKLSKNKKRKINAAKREEKKKRKEVEERILRFWEQLYWDRHKSDDDFQRYIDTPVPEWLESDNFNVDGSVQVLRRTDLKYDGSDFRRYKFMESF